MNIYGLTPRSYDAGDGKTLFKFTLYWNGTDYVFKNLADEATAMKYRLFLKRLKIMLGDAFNPMSYQIHHTDQQPLTNDEVTAIIERARIGHIPPETGLLLFPKLADSVIAYQWKNGETRYGFTLSVRGNRHGFRGYTTRDAALAARLHLMKLRAQLGDQFDPKHYQRHRSPDAPLLLPLRPKGLGRLTKTFGEYAQQWLETQRGKITPTRWKLTRAHLQASVLERWAYKELRGIDEGAFQALIDWLLESHAPASVHGIGSTVAKILVAARRDGLLSIPFQPHPLLYGLR